MVTKSPELMVMKYTPLSKEERSSWCVVPSICSPESSFPVRERISTRYVPALSISMFRKLPAGFGFQFEVKITDTTENKSKPMLDRVTLAFE